MTVTEQAEHTNTDQHQRPLPAGWRWVRLGDIADIIAGQSPPGETYRKKPEGLPFFQGKADFGLVHPSAATWCVAPIKIARIGDILISVRAPVGPTNIADQECCIGRGLAAIRPKIDVDKTLFSMASVFMKTILPSLEAVVLFRLSAWVCLPHCNSPSPPSPNKSASRRS